MTRTLNVKFVLIDFAASNKRLKYTIKIQSEERLRADILH